MPRNEIYSLQSPAYQKKDISRNGEHHMDWSGRATWGFYGHLIKAWTRNIWLILQKLVDTLLLTLTHSLTHYPGLD